MPEAGALWCVYQPSSARPPFDLNPDQSNLEGRDVAAVQTDRPFAGKDPTDDIHTLSQYF